VYNPVCYSSAMRQKSAVLSVNGYHEDRRFVLHYDLWVRAAAAGFRLGRIEMPLMAKRKYPGSIVPAFGALALFFARLKIQIRAVRVSGLRPNVLPLIAARVLWAILPLRLPLNLRRLASRLSAGNRR
jgi:hypothetical protein